MKRILPIIIISIIIKGYNNECTKGEGNICISNEEGITRCIYDETKAECEEKTLCELAENPQNDDNCKDIQSPENTKCTFVSG